MGEFNIWVEVNLSFIIVLRRIYNEAIINVGQILGAWIRDLSEGNMVELGEEDFPHVLCLSGPG